MNDNVVTLPRRDGAVAILVCPCGCTAHYHRVDGSVACGSCEMILDAAMANWRLRYPEAPTEPRELDGDNFKVTDIASADIFLRRQIKASGQRDVAAAVVIFADGASATWAPDVDTAERRDWLRRHMAEATRRLTGA